MPQHATRIYKTMLNAVNQTFENMAFVEVTEQPAELRLKLPADPVWVSILIHNPVQGEIRLALPRPLLAELTATMFGIEPEEVVPFQTQDIIAEILNTLAGLFMTRLIPENQTYQLGLPEHGAGPLPETEDGSIVWNLQIEEKPLLLVASGISLTRTDS